ncbi:hypothetical protein HGM15179_019713 [Zosterops borbonicus]|uniref:Uncharacterized protein n=1 Tax=Zosterops borbonicus TaxID=364589 RepID=A0A8K1D7N3_9PASS|nr:hypothetical protein HGM15179_019713 [Zosterops borbonicus]
MKVSRIEERKKDKGKMDIELGAAVRLFRNMLSKRGERIKESELEQSALWARKKGQLQKASLMFSTTEWREIGDLLWSTVISGGKEGKIAQELGAVWGKVFRTLQFVSTEKKAATAAIQAFEGSVQEKPEPPSSRKPKTVKILSLCNRPICGLSASVSPTPQDVLDQVTKAEDLSPPPPTQTESETEVLQSLHSVGVKTGGDSALCQSLSKDVICLTTVSDSWGPGPQTLKEAPGLAEVERWPGLGGLNFARFRKRLDVVWEPWFKYIMGSQRILASTRVNPLDDSSLNACELSRILT